MLFYSRPYGALTVSTYGSLSRYRISQALRYNHVILRGDSAQAALRADYVIFRNRSRIDSLMAQMTYKRSRNYLNDTLIGVSSPSLEYRRYCRLHRLDSGTGRCYQHLFIGGEGHHTVRGSYPEHHAGLDPQYTKGKFSLSYIQQFSLSEDAYLFSSHLAGQYTQDHLPRGVADTVG